MATTEESMVSVNVTSDKQNDRISSCGDSEDGDPEELPVSRGNKLPHVIQSSLLHFKMCKVSLIVSLTCTVCCR